MATINGTAGNDVITGTTANDEINGGAGNDRINGGAGDDVIYGGDGNDTLTGDAGNDTLYGGNGNDGFFGGGGNDTMYGEAGDDVMYGDAGNDAIYGGDGNDQLFGGTGDDVLYGGAGTNILNGGAGNDTFVLEFDSATMTSAMRADLATLKNWFQSQAASAGSASALAAQTSGPSLTLSALGVTISNIEHVKIFLDGVEKSLESFLNTAPTADANVSVSTDEDTPLSGQIAANDADGDVLAYAVQQAPTNGTLTLNATTGAYVYTPAANYHGADSFQVTVSDPSGLSVVQTVSVGVTSINDAPTAAATVAISTDEDTAITGQIVAADIDGDTLAYAVQQAPTNGTLTLNAATGAYVYTPSANYNGADSFQVIVTDSSGAAVVQTVSVGVTPVNDAPTADANVAVTTDEDTPVFGQIVAADVDGDTLSYAVQQAPTNGTLTLNATTGAYVYTPAANYHGADSFQVTVTDASGAAVVQTVSVGVTPVNDAPTAAAAVAISTDEDTPVTGQIVAADIDGDTLAYGVQNAPSHGTLTLNAATGAYVYTPTANYNGVDSFEVTVTDPSGAQVVQTVSVGVTPANDAPTAAASVAISTNEDTPVAGQIVAADVDGDTLAYAVQQAPTNGTLTLNAATGAYVYTPAANYHGADSFQVTVADPSGAQVVQTISVGVTSVNDAPTAAANLSLTTDEDTVVAGHITASDIDGDTLAYAVQQAPTNGTLTLNATTGAYVYTPAANYNGADSFKVTVTDTSGAAVVQTISIGVTSVNDTPTAAAAVAISTKEDTPVTGQIVAADVDGDALAYGVQNAPSHGTLTLNATTGVYVYTPAANYNGADSFKVTVTDPSGAQVVQTVSVGVTSVNDAPTAVANVSVTTAEDTAVSGQVIATDIDGDTLGYALAQGPQHGSLTLNASTGQYVYTPAANFNGSDSFRVAIADPSGAAVVQTITVGVTPVNDAVKIAQASVSFATQEDKAVSGQVIASDVDGDTLSWSIDTAPSHGTVSLNAATGQYTYTPAANYSGNDAFNVAVTDPSGTRAMQRVELSISPVADQPTLAVVNPIVVPATTPGSLGLIGDLLGTILGTKGDDTIDAGIWADVTVALEIDAALVDRDGSETLSIRISDVPANGVLSSGVKNADGSWTVSPDELRGLTLTAETNQNFSVKVEATATESNGAIATKTATIDIIMKSDGVTINGGNGNDTISGSTGNDKLSGGNGNDTIYGGEGADRIDGGKGNDTLHGGAGNDYLNGNSGDDTFIWDAGNDVYAGGSGYDTLSYAGAGSGINADLSKKIIYGDASGTDSIYGSAMEKIIGTSFADIFKGSSGVDTIDGGAGNDWIRGLGGADILTGGAGNDTFFWEKTDVGSGMGVDRIKDFSTGDILDFTKLVSLGSKSLADIVKVQDVSQGLIVSAKIGSAFVQIASLDDVHGKSAAQLFADGQLLVG